jgi:C-terminal processing protease CtpA/Prc
VLGLTLDEAVDMMRGPVGSEIIITVVREGTPEPFDVSIIRDTIKLTAVKAASSARPWCCGSPPSTTRPPPAWSRP